MGAEHFEKRFLDLYTIIADAPSLEEALNRLSRHAKGLLEASSVRAVVDVDPPSGADDVFSLAEPGSESTWLHLAVSWGKGRRPDATVLRAWRGSLALLVPFLAQRRRLDQAMQHLQDAPADLGRLETSLEESELQRLLQKLVERSVREVSATSGAVLLPDPASNGLTLEATAYVGALTLDPKTLPRILHRRKPAASASVQERRRGRASDLIFLVYDSGLPYRTGRIQEDPHSVTLFRDSRSNLTVPLLLGGSPVGVLMVESTKSDAFTPQHQDRLWQFAETAAALLAKTRTYEQTRSGGPMQTLRLFGFSSEIITRAHKAAVRDFPLLLRGEKGTGKEMLARYIHRMSRRSARPYVVADGTTLARNIQANARGGTLFVEDIDHLPQASQEFLARLIRESRDITVVASSCGAPVIPLLAQAFGTNEIKLPPLRERPEAIVALARLILREVSENRGGPLKLLSAPATEALQRYPFPGNFQELRDVIETAAAAAEGPVIQPFHLPPKVVGKSEPGRARPFRAMQEETEKAYLTELLTRTKGDLTEAARHAALEPAELQTLLRKHTIRPADFSLTAGSPR